jgi:hypothetical protein
VLASRILSFEGSFETDKILHFVQHGPQTLNFEQRHMPIARNRRGSLLGLSAVNNLG